jgi:hypothetical protein
MAEITKSILNEVDIEFSVIVEGREDREGRIGAGIESAETCSNAMRLALRENLSSVILEPIPGSAWQYSRAGTLVARNQETLVVMAKSKGTPYAICVPGNDGIWYCSIVEKGMLVKSIQTRL